MNQAPDTTLAQHIEAKREIAKLTDEQIDALDWAVAHDHMSSGRRAVAIYREAVRRGWLLGPA